MSLYSWIAQRGDQEGLLDVRVAESMVGERFFSDVAFPGALPGIDAWLAVGPVIEVRRAPPERP